MSQQNSVQVLKTFLQRFEFPYTHNRMFFSDWFLARLLRQNNGNIRKSTFALKDLRAKWNLLHELNEIGRFRKSRILLLKSRTPGFREL